MVSATISAAAQTPQSWPNAGGGIFNTHAALSPLANINSPSQINPATAHALAVKWSYTTAGDISATPTVEPGGLYVPDWAGLLYKLDPATGKLLWSHAVCDYTSTCNNGRASFSRTAPAIGTNNVVIGDAMAHDNLAAYGATVIGVNKSTGARAWTTIVNNTSKYAAVLGSPVIYNNIAYVGTSSWEEGVAGSNPKYQPVFRGNISALNVDTGAIIWQFTSVPAGYAGGPFPGSTMAVWPAQNALLTTTGNNYAVPASVSACVGAAGSNNAAQVACLDPTNYVDSMVSLNLTTGTLNWGRRMAGADNFTEACWFSPGDCPAPAGTDSDFAQGPMLTWVPNFIGVPDDRGGTSRSYMMAAGQKNSVFYAVNPLNGGLFWSTMIGIGGIEWGSTLNTDDYNHFYVALHNPEHVPQTIAGQSLDGVHAGPNPMAWNAGAWTALDMRTGNTVWTMPASASDLRRPSLGAAAPGCLTFTNRVLFAGDSSGNFVGMNANTGYKYWTFNSGGTVVSCPAVFNETLYWGTGYARNGIGYHKLYAISVGGV